MKFVFLFATLVLSSFGIVSEASAAPAADCELKVNCNCSAPGFTSRWELAYCGSVHGTDDYMSDLVQVCVEEGRAQLASKTACEKNQTYREQLCRLIYKSDSSKLRDCERNLIPSVVQDGI